MSLQSVRAGARGCEPLLVTPTDVSAKSATSARSFASEAHDCIGCRQW